MAASLVLVGAYARVTGLVGIDSMVEAMRESVPAYRRQHLETNEKALRVGFEAGPAAEEVAEILEWCHEGNHSIPNILLGARAIDRADQPD